MAKKNEGAPGIDGVTFATIEAGGGESFLQQIGDERVTNTYQPIRVRKKEIPQEGGTKVRILSIPSIRDRVVQGARKLILEPIFEADFQSGSYGYRVEINEEKSRIVDLRKGGSCGFLGFEFRRVRSLPGAWRPQYTPKLKKRTALLAKRRDLLRKFASQPVGRVIELINPILRGGVNYFAVGHSSRCFAFIQDWVERKTRRHLMRARNRRGFGWKRGSREWLDNVLGLFPEYRVRHLGSLPKVARAR